MRKPQRSFFAILMLSICWAPLPSWGAPSTLFQFRNGFWINLHHFLYAEALAQSVSGNARWISSAQAALKLAPCTAFPSSEMKQNWDNAVQFYSSNYASRDMLFDHDFAHLNDELGNAGNAKDLPADLPADLMRELVRAAPAYRESCWANHRKLNDEWISSLKPLLAAHGQNIAHRLTEIFETPCRPLPFLWML